MKPTFLSKLHTVLQPKNTKGQRINTEIHLLSDGESAEVVTNTGFRILISTSDVDAVVGRNWHVSKVGYAFSNPSKASKGCYMHRHLMGVPDGQLIDHINGNRLDNRRENLRICTFLGNAQNKGMADSNRSGFKGVYQHGGKGSFISRIHVNGVAKHLGSYKTAEEAHEVYCLAADMLHGEFANHGGRNV